MRNVGSLPYHLLLACLSPYKDLISLQTLLGLLVDTPGGVVIYTFSSVSPCKSALFTSSWSICIFCMKPKL